MREEKQTGVTEVLIHVAIVFFVLWCVYIIIDS